MLTFLKSQAKRLRTSERGSASIEMVLMVPLLVFVIVATVVYFEGFRSKYQLQKTTATIADTLSRELTTIDSDYLDGIDQLFEVLTPGLADRGMRVTAVRYDATNDSHHVVWSEIRGEFNEVYQDDDLIDIKDKFPLMADIERYIIVETAAAFSSNLDRYFGGVLGRVVFYDWVPISPRFAGRLCYEDASMDEPAC